MSDPESLGIGNHLVRIRTRRGMTQEELSDRSGVHVSTIRKLEQGGRSSCTLETLNRLARALAVTTADLFRPLPQFRPQLEDTEQRDDLLAIRQALQPARSLPGVLVDEVNGEPNLAGLRASLHTATRMYHDDRYVETIRAVPSLLAEARSAVAFLSGDDQAAAYTILAQAYRVVASVLTHLHYEDLALRALDLSMDAAEQSGNQLVAAAGVVTECWVLIRQGRFAEAEQVAIATADAIEPRISTASRTELSTWGWLLLRASAAAVRNSESGKADDVMNLAQVAAQGVVLDAVDYDEYWTTFGPATVAMKAVENAVVAGKPDRALLLASRVPPQGRPTSNNRNRFLLDRASALSDQRAHGEALDVLLGIKGDAPEWLEHQHYARRITSRLITARKRSLTPELRELADFLHMDVLS